MISCTDGISCIITLIVLASPYLVLCATTPFRLKVYARYLAFTHLDRKTEVISLTVEGICAMQAICSFSFMAIGGFTDVLLILYALSMTCAWLSIGNPEAVNEVPRAPRSIIAYVAGSILGIVHKRMPNMLKVYSDLMRPSSF